jgi:hypothetical protein
MKCIILSREFKNRLEWLGREDSNRVFLESLNWMLTLLNPKNNLARNNVVPGQDSVRFFYYFNFLKWHLLKFSFFYRTTFTTRFIITLTCEVLLKKV